MPTMRITDDEGVSQLISYSNREFRTLTHITEKIKNGKNNIRKRNS